jgi:hypothetical protein
MDLVSHSSTAQLPRNQKFRTILSSIVPFVDPWPLFQFRNPIHSRYDSLDGGSARRKAATYTQNNTNTE